MCNFADGGRAARRAEQKGGMKEEGGRMRDGICGEIENKDLFVFKAFP